MCPLAPSSLRLFADHDRDLRCAAGRSGGRPKGAGKMCRVSRWVSRLPPASHRDIGPSARCAPTERSSLLPRDWLPQHRPGRASTGNRRPFLPYSCFPRRPKGAGALKRSGQNGAPPSGSPTCGADPAPRAVSAVRVGKEPSFDILSPHYLLPIYNRGAGQGVSLPLRGKGGDCAARWRANCPFYRSPC